MDAGHCVLTGPSTVFLIACRLAGPGAIAKSLGRAINVGIVNDKRIAWDFVQSSKGAVIHLLVSTHFIEFNHLYCFRIIEITEWWIDEGEMSVLSDSQHREVRRILFEQFRITIRFLAFRPGHRRADHETHRAALCSRGDRSGNGETIAELVHPFPGTHRDEKQ